MSYVTRAQLIRQFGEQTLILLTDRDGLGVIDDEVLDGAVVAAEATVNGYIGGRYPLPLSPVTEDVSGAVFSIARYNLDGDNGNEIVKTRYDSTIAWLKDVSAGRAILAGVNSVAPVASAASRIEITSSATVFGRGVRW